MLGEDEGDGTIPPGGFKLGLANIFRGFKASFASAIHLDLSKPLEAIRVELSGISKAVSMIVGKMSSRSDGEIGGKREEKRDDKEDSESSKKPKHSRPGDVFANLFHRGSIFTGNKIEIARHLLNFTMPRLTSAFYGSSKKKSDPSTPKEDAEEEKPEIDWLTVAKNRLAKRMGRGFVKSELSATPGSMPTGFKGGRPIFDRSPPPGATGAGGAEAAGAAGGAARGAGMLGGLEGIGVSLGASLATIGGMAGVVAGAFVAVGAAAMSLADKLTAFAATLKDVSPSIARSFAKSDVADIFRNMRLGEAIAPSFDKLNTAMTEFKDIVAPFMAKMINILSNISAKIIQLINALIKPMIETSGVAWELLRKTNVGIDILDRLYHWMIREEKQENKDQAMVLYLRALARGELAGAR